jgi:hypothetical protein
LIPGIISQNIKRPERKTSHSPLSSAEVKKLSSFITATEVDKYSYSYSFKPTVHATLKNSLSYRKKNSSIIKKKTLMLCREKFVVYSENSRKQM